MSIKLRYFLFLLLFCNAVWAYADNAALDCFKPYPIFDDLNFSDDNATGDDSDSDCDNIAAQNCRRELASECHSLPPISYNHDRAIISFYYYTLYPRAPPAII